MGKGRKKIPTEIKKLRGTLQKCRETESQMNVKRSGRIPDAPDWLSEVGREQYYKVTNELWNKNMLYEVDLALVIAYSNEMALYIETEKLLRTKSRIYAKHDKDGNIVYAASVPYQKIANDALNKAIKLAVQFGFTPSARTNIQRIETNEYKDTIGDIIDIDK